MENRENKIIADKINSLDSLPEGYNPNLDAKWAMLQSDEKKEKAVLLWNNRTWMKIAACFLILLLSGIIWINKTTQPKSEIANTSPSIKPTIEHSEKIVSHSEINASSNSIMQEVKKENRNKARISIPVHEESVRQEEQVAIIPVTIDSSISTVIENNSTIAITKAKKSRYVQMDFEDAIIQPATKTTFAQGFQFRLGLKSSGSIEQNSNDNSSIKLKRNF